MSSRCPHAHTRTFVSPDEVCLPADSHRHRGDQPAVAEPKQNWRPPDRHPQDKNHGDGIKPSVCRSHDRSETVVMAAQSKTVSSLRCWRDIKSLSTSSTAHRQQHQHTHGRHKAPRAADRHTRDKGNDIRHTHTERDKPSRQRQAQRGTSVCEPSCGVCLWLSESLPVVHRAQHTLVCRLQSATE